MSKIPNLPSLLSPSTTPAQNMNWHFVSRAFLLALYFGFLFCGTQLLLLPLP
jgi:hypothetical protein